MFRRSLALPLYEYECPKCGTFERVQKFSDPLLKKCPTCDSPVEKLLSAPAIQFKGSGWYITDYARKSSGGKEGGEKGSGEQGSGEKGSSEKASGEKGSKETGGQKDSSGSAGSKDAGTSTAKTSGKS